MSARLLAFVDVDCYLRHGIEVDASSGLDGQAHFHPYSQSEPLDLNEAREREITRWSTPTNEPAWRRAWGLFDRSEPVGYLYLAGGALRSELHRVTIGMGIAPSHRRRGGGTLLLQTAIVWARRQHCIDWIDLGVLSDNHGAQALYARQGFQVNGRTSDRFRVDGHSLDEISMTLSVVSGD